MLSKRTKTKTICEPYESSPHLHVQYELDFGNDTIKPGDSIKFKGERGTFKFRYMVHNIKEDVTWIDCMNVKNGSFHAFYIDQLKTVLRPKKSYAKKINEQ